MTRKEAIAFLTREGNFRVPCSRYGRDSLECAAVTWRAAQRLDDPPTFEDLEYLMGLVVNDHDDIAYLLKR